MFKCLAGLKRKRKATGRSLNCSTDEETLILGEAAKAKLRSPQSASSSSEVIFAFENGNAFSKKKQTMQPESAEKKRDTSSPKLLQTIIGWGWAKPSASADNTDTRFW